MESIGSVSSWKGEKLTSSAQWHSWYMAMRRLGQSLRVWDMCNPELGRSTVVQPRELPTMPAQPALDIPEEITPAGLKSLKEVFKENQSIWRDEMDIYRLRLAEFERQEKGLRTIDLAISASVEPQMNRVLDRMDTAYERMRYLASRFSRTNAYGVEVFLRWRDEATKGPEKGEDVLKWLNNWESCCS